MINKSIRFFTLSLTAMLGLVLLSCGRPAAPPPAGDVAVVTVDSITVYCDEAFRYLIDQEVTVYEASIPGKHINVVYKTEAEVLNILMKDSFSTVVLGRRLRQPEKDDIFKNGHLQVDERAFAKDAVAIVADPAFAHDTLEYNLVSALIAGTSNRYKLVFEGNGSGVVSYMFMQFGKGAKPSAFAAKNMDELVEYLGKDKNAIGFIPFVRISDEDDKASRELLKKVKILAVSRPDSTGRIVISTASQSEIADGSYPLARPINFIQHSMDEKVGTGFANFLIKDQSGRVILKTGLVPSYMPSRTINVNTDGIK